MWNEIRTVSGATGRRGVGSMGLDNGEHSEAKLAWLSPTTGEREPRTGGGCLHVLLQQFRYYCDNSSLAGYKYITETRRTWFERFMWIVLHSITVSALGIVVWKVSQDYKHTPTVTVVDSDHYPSNYLDLPAVSVCSINRISREKVASLAQHIQAANITKASEKEILNLLYELGHLYESSFNITEDNGDELDELLQHYFHGSYQLTQLMKQLTPRCTSTFIKCRFRSETRNCSELFYFRKTQDGFCCTFNYARESDDVYGSADKNRIKDAYKIEKLGILNGLTFLMDSHLDDYFFPILPVSGWKITIFNPGDYPDNTSGGVSDALISPGTENFLELNAVSFFSEESLKRYDVDERKCIFNDEISALYDGYTYSDCIVDCKVDDVWQTCGCRPFFYPQRDSRRVCNTSDVHCLHKYKSKWWSVLPHDIRQRAQESKMFNVISNESWSLRCQRCYPSCNDVRYYLQASSVRLEQDDQSVLLRDINIQNKSLVHVFFNKYGTVRLKQDIAYFWYELLSNIGGLCGVFIGFSLISAVELIYFCVLSAMRLWIRSGKSKPIDTGSNTIPTNSVRTLYWSELVPRGNVKTVNSTWRTIKY